MCRYVRLNALNVLHVPRPCFIAPVNFSHLNVPPKFNHLVPVYNGTGLVFFEFLLLVAAGYILMGYGILLYEIGSVRFGNGQD